MLGTARNFGLLHRHRTEPRRYQHDLENAVICCRQGRNDAAPTHQEVITALPCAHHIIENVEEFDAYSRVLADAEYSQRSLVDGLSLPSSNAQLQHLLMPTEAGETAAGELRYQEEKRMALTSVHISNDPSSRVHIGRHRSIKRCLPKSNDKGE